MRILHFPLIGPLTEHYGEKLTKLDAFRNLPNVGQSSITRHRIFARNLKDQNLLFTVARRLGPLSSTVRARGAHLPLQHTNLRWQTACLHHTRALC